MTGAGRAAPAGVGWLVAGVFSLQADGADSSPGCGVGVDAVAVTLGIGELREGRRLVEAEAVCVEAGHVWAPGGVVGCWFGCVGVAG